MDFGRVAPGELENIDFTLPAEPGWNASILPGSKTTSPQVYIGCPKWGVKEWLGKIYPKGTKDTLFLDQYVRHFNAIELNATHYKVYGADTIEKWAAKAKGLPFKFCPKVPQAISHYSSFVQIDGMTNDFLAGIIALKNHLGPVFLQVSEKFAPSRRQNLFQYIAQWPKDVPLFLEVRHTEWFENAAIFAELLAFLKEQQVGLVITDTSDRREAAHMHLTIPICFIRFVANSLHATDYTRIDAWIQRLTHWVNKGVQEIYFFVHMPDEVYSPELCVYITDKLNEACGLHLKKPAFIQHSLF